MKYLLIIIVGICFTATMEWHADSATKNKSKMKLNAGIITTRLAESKAFYTGVLGFGVTFENEFYLLMHTPNKESEISFLLPDHPSQQSLFHKPFTGQGMFLTIEVDDVDKMYNDIRNTGTEIKIDIRNEAWGDRHFAIEDPNGIAIDLVNYQAPANPSSSDHP